MQKTTLYRNKHCVEEQHCTENNIVQKNNTVQKTTLCRKHYCVEKQQICRKIRTRGHTILKQQHKYTEQITEQLPTSDTPAENRLLHQE